MSERSPWTDRAACNGVNTDRFVVHVKPHNTGGHDASLKMAAALAICQSCPVRRECRDYMVGWPDPPRDIVIAGLTPKQARMVWLQANGATPHSHTRRTA